VTACCGESPAHHPLPPFPQAPNQINGAECLLQLRFAGVFEAVSIRKQGYPFRDKHAAFYKKYAEAVARLKCFL